MPRARTPQLAVNRRKQPGNIRKKTWGPEVLSSFKPADINPRELLAVGGHGTRGRFEFVAFTGRIRKRLGIRPRDKIWFRRSPSSTYYVIVEGGDPSTNKQAGMVTLEITDPEIIQTLDYFNKQGRSRQTTGKKAK